MWDLEVFWVRSRPLHGREEAVLHFSLWISPPPGGPSQDRSFHIFNKAHLLILIDCVYCILYFKKDLQKPKVIQIFLYISP